MNHRVFRLLFSLLLLVVAAVTKAEAPQGAAKVACAMEKVEVERLPDLNIPRSGHRLLCLDGELVVFGGHTSGFVLTPTAEYFHDGKWHVVPMVYPHDFGFVLTLRSGKVLLGGGAEKNLGIGQTYSVEQYDPETRTFEGFGCLDRKRMYPFAAELASGQVVISGNWYHQDDVELFDGRKFFTHAKDVSCQRASPFILPIAKDDALIMGSIDTVGRYRAQDYQTVDRLKGDPIVMPLLAEWSFRNHLISSPVRSCFVGNEDRGDYSYLMLMENSRHTLAVGRLSGTTLQLLPSVSPVPQEGPYGPIHYYPGIVIDRKADRAYIVGHSPDERKYLDQDTLRRYYVYSFSLAQAAADPGAMQIDSTATGNGTLYYTDPLPQLGDCNAVVTPEGNLAMVAGVTTDNFYPTDGAYLLLFGQRPTTAGTAAASVPWRWMLLALLVLVVTAAAIIYNKVKRRQRSVASAEPADSTDPAAAADAVVDVPAALASELMPRICALMDEQQLFLNSELKLPEVATLLGVNARYVSDSIKISNGQSFSQFVSAYRVDYAKQLLLGNPDKKIIDVGMQSGFANEMSFFRTFKAFTGMTPKEWVAKGRKTYQAE